MLAGGLVLAATVPAVPALAQETEIIEVEKVVYQKKTVVSFDDDTIDGDLTKPDGDYVEIRKRIRHSNLIKVREDFRANVLDSVSQI